MTMSIDKKFSNYFHLLLPLSFIADYRLSIIGLFLILILKEYFTPVERRVTNILSLITAHTILRKVGYLYVFLAASLLLNSIYMGHYYGAPSLLSGYFFVILSPLILLGFRHSRRADLLNFLAGCKLAVVVSALYAITLFIIKDFPERIHWNSQLGSIFLGLALLRFQHESNAAKVWTLFVITIGLVSISLSGTRTSLLLCLFLFTVITFFPILKSPTKRPPLRLYVFLVSLLVILTISNSATLKRVQHSTQSILLLALGLDQESANVDSSGIRLEIFRATLETFDENPNLFGLSGHETMAVILPNIKERFLQFTSHHTHLHSSYLDFLIFGGLIMAVVILIFHFVQLFLILKFRYSLQQVILVVIISSFTFISIFDSLYASSKEVILLIVISGMVYGSIIRDTFNERFLSDPHLKSTQKYF